MSLLQTLNLPQDLKKLSCEQMTQLAQEIREELIEITQTCGGHLASNLGIVEITLALHTVFASPKDKIIWDTSHQSYVHKMVTGRLDKMYTIRQEDGLSGFAKISESDHDIFGAGHASTALSAGLGLACARDQGEKDHAVISVIGDASLSGGMAFEALNNVSQLNTNFICILNDNNMSISKPVGNMATYMTKIRTSPHYNKLKRKYEALCLRVPRIGAPLVRVSQKIVNKFRNMIFNVKAGVLFEEFGFQYLGPIDGHNLNSLFTTLAYAKQARRPVLIHCITKKGKGVQEIESDPIKYHGVSPKKASSKEGKLPNPTFTQVFGLKMIDLAYQNSKIQVITPAMRSGSGLDEYSNLFPERFYDVGIAEEHAVTFAAGLARAGERPVLSIYSTFLQRGYDQIIHDVCLQKLPVVFALDRAGIVGEDGPTHHGVFDYSYLLPIPNITILSPKDQFELETMLEWSVTQDLAVSIRYPKGAVPCPINVPKDILTPQILVDHPDPDLTLFSTGTSSIDAFKAAQQLNDEGGRCRAVHLPCLKPLNVSVLQSYFSESAHVICIEEGMVIGGMGSFLQSQFQTRHHVSWTNLGVSDLFIDHGKINALKEKCGLTPQNIIATANLVLHKSLATS